MILLAVFRIDNILLILCQHFAGSMKQSLMIVLRRKRTLKQQLYRIGSKIDNVEAVKYHIEVAQIRIKFRMLDMIRILRDIPDTRFDERMPVRLQDDLQADADVVATDGAEINLIFPALARSLQEFAHIAVQRGILVAVQCILQLRHGITDDFYTLAVGLVRIKIMEGIFRKIHDGQRLIRRIDKRVCLVVVWMPAARLNANLLRFDMGKRPRERLRLAKEETLQPSAANRSEEFHLLLSLHTFHERLDAEFLGHGNDRSDDLAGFFRERAPKAHIELDEVAVDILQKVQR